ncbi:trehalose-phosphatase [Nocardioides donggukensis]|uniref:Trehalose 6-phosphate phosphatase n=1 Tax=Nocardioides donggukensis TaxID=2774019 RepID=A0A927K3M8_9ACTN|nr:trehalose-phosphatase [Nocardioides donggukensis]MBD8868400.1 trehalose-phosphatase [Nocardioides donggukensis]
MEFSSPDGERRYAALVRSAGATVVGLDFDGTLSPIVDDPEAAGIHPAAPGVLVALAEQVHAVAVVTGRPARQVLALGGLDEVGDAMGEAGHELLVFGQYGNERWTSFDRRVVSPRPPAGLSSFLSELPGLLRRGEAAEAYVEDKGLAVAVHTRRLPDPAGAFERLLPLLSAAADAHDLAVEPGRNVVEVRAPGMHKGAVVQRLAADPEVRGFVFVGDDLGDREAFEAVAELRAGGADTLLVCADHDEDEGSALRDLADVVVAGPDGVLDFLRTLTADAARK